MNGPNAGATPTSAIVPGLTAPALTVPGRDDLRADEGGAGKKWAVGGAGSEFGPEAVGPDQPTLVDGRGRRAELGVAAASACGGSRSMNELCAWMALAWNKHLGLVTWGWVAQS